MYLSVKYFCNNMRIALGSQAQSSEIKLSYVRKKLCTKSQEFSHTFRAFVLDVLLARLGWLVLPFLYARDAEHSGGFGYYMLSVMSPHIKRSWLACVCIFTPLNTGRFTMSTFYS